MPSTLARLAAASSRMATNDLNDSERETARAIARHLDLAIEHADTDEDTDEQCAFATALESFLDAIALRHLEHADDETSPAA